MGLRIKVPFDEFKVIYSKKKIAVQCHETSNAFELSIIENGHEWYCPVYKVGETEYDAQVMADYTANKINMRVNSSVEKRAEDGRMLMQPVTLDSHLWHRFTSYGDDDLVGNGTPIRAVLEPGDENRIIDISFRDWVQVVGGIMKFEGGEITNDDGDWVSFRVIIPSAQALHPASGSEGNAMIFMNTVIPYPGGPYVLDTTKTAFVPADAYTGFWDWDWPDNGHGDLRPNYTQQGEFHVITPDFAAVEFVGKSFLLGKGERNYTPPNPHPTYVYPGWVMRVEIHKIQNGTTPLKLVSELQTARKSTV